MLMTNCLTFLKILKRHHLFYNFLHDWSYKNRSGKGYAKGDEERFHPNVNKIID